MANVIATRKALEAAVSQIERDTAHLRDLSRSLTKTRHALHRANLAAFDSLRFFGTASASGMMEPAQAGAACSPETIGPAGPRSVTSTVVPF
jgi:hypothetical protein